MALRWKAYAPNTILKSVEVQDLADNGVVQLDTAADLASADLVNANTAFALSDHNIYKRNAPGVGADKWGAVGGTIRQIVRATDTTNRTTTSSSITDVAGMSVTITPQKSDSAIIVAASLGFIRAETPSAGNPSGVLFITDSSNNILAGGRAHFGTLDANIRHDCAMFWWGYSTPATTSATTYKLRVMCSAANTTVSIFNATTTGQLYAIEVGA